MSAGVVFEKPWRNAALTFLPDGSLRTYDKRHLLLPGEGKFTPGTGSGLLGGGNAVAICKDLDFPRTLRADARSALGGIRLMAVPANDFVRDNWIHARMAVMRGVESGFSIARAAKEGLLTLSDDRGRLLAEQSSSASVPFSSIVANVPVRNSVTFYARFGDWFAWLNIALLLGVLGSLGFNRASSQN